MRAVFRDRWLLVVDKPSGMASQPDEDGSGRDMFTLMSRRERYVGLHHRLDQPASGLIVVALDPTVNASLAGLFFNHQVERTYLAILAGDALVAGQKLVWDKPLEGVPAVTDVEVLGTGGGMIAARFTLQTGRNHQIRQHAAMAGVPIVGDRRYGGDAGTWLERLALHAARLRLTHPVTGKVMTWTAPLPPPLDRAWTAAGGPPDAEKAGAVDAAKG